MLELNNVTVPLFVSTPGPLMVLLDALTTPFAPTVIDPPMVSVRPPIANVCVPLAPPTCNCATFGETSSVTV